jgi:hypothetical protein
MLLKPLMTIHMHKLILITLLSIPSLFGYGQSNFKKKHDFGLALSYAPNEFAGALSWKQMHGITSKAKFKLGYGLRFNAYAATNRSYITAPAYLTSGEKGPQVLFIENTEENIDTFSVAKAQHNSLNAVIYLEYDISDKWGVGFNIDAAGIAFGKEVLGTPISSNKPVNTVNQLSAKPTAYNVLLISDNDIGMLNSELYVKYSVTKKLTVSVGFTFLFTEYTTTEKITYNDNNDRFRNKSLLGMISINYKPFKK